MSQSIAVRVDAVRELTPVIREFTLVPPQGALPGFSSGSHILVEVPLGERTLRNAYSLLSDPADVSHYRIAVRLQDSSRGGSRFLHESVEAGDDLHISPPANLFAPSSRARHHLLIAGGIGITPFMSYIASLRPARASFELHYAFRGGVTDAYLDTLQFALGRRLHCYDGARGERLSIQHLLAVQPMGTHAYVCGPASLLKAVQNAAAALGWPTGRLHWEAFAAPEPGEPFLARLGRSGVEVAVGGDYSLLEALEKAGVEVPNLCRGGVCGQCVTGYLDGAVEHRDSFLGPAQQSTHLMPCVSRGRCGSTVLLDI